MIEHRPPGDRMQHLVDVGLHPRALAGGEDDGGEGSGSDHGDAGRCHGNAEFHSLGQAAALPLDAAAMAAFPFDVVAFDLDGTLADTAPDLAAALNHALGRLGRPPIALDAVRGLVGHGGKALLRRALQATGGGSEQLVEAAFPIFLDYYSAHLCIGTTVYPGSSRRWTSLPRAAPGSPSAPTRVSD